MNISFGSETGRASVKQEQRIMKEEIGQAYRLGVYQKKYPFQFTKALAIGTFLFPSAFFKVDELYATFDRKITFYNIPDE